MLSSHVSSRASVGSEGRVRGLGQGQGSGAVYAPTRAGVWEKPTQPAGQGQVDARGGRSARDAHRPAPRCPYLHRRLWGHGTQYHLRYYKTGACAHGRTRVTPL